MDRSNRRGLTSSETLVIAAIVATCALLISWYFVGAPDSDSRETTIQRVKTVSAALEKYAIDNGGVFPTTQQGLEALVVQPSDEDRQVRWRGPYIDDPETLTDAWGAPLHYVSPVPDQTPYHQWSSGADRAEGGDGADADIQSWDRSTMTP
jgi:general secretion pathway protein G